MDNTLLAGSFLLLYSTQGNNKSINLTFRCHKKYTDHKHTKGAFHFNTGSEHTNQEIHAETKFYTCTCIFIIPVNQV